MPTVYCLTIAQYDSARQHAVSCAAGVTLADAAEKAARDAIMYRVATLRQDPVKTDSPSWRMVRATWACPRTRTGSISCWTASRTPSPERAALSADPGQRLSTGGRPRRGRPAGGLGDLDKTRDANPLWGYQRLLVRAGALGYAVLLAALSAGLCGCPYGGASAGLSPLLRRSWPGSSPVHGLSRLAD